MSTEQLPARTDDYQKIIENIEWGVACWEKAGKAITLARHHHPDCYAKLIALRPWITPAMLNTMERIGRREVYPYVILESSTVSRWLLAYSYDEQFKACTEGVKVLLGYKNGKPIHQTKTIRELSRSDSKQVFGPTRIRRLDEQLQYLPMKAGATENHNGVDFAKGMSSHLRIQSESNRIPSPEITPAGIPASQHDELVGLFRITLSDRQHIIEKVSAAPPEAQVIRASRKAGKLVAYVKLVETVVGDALSEKELAYRELRATIKTDEAVVED